MINHFTGFIFANAFFDHLPVVVLEGEILRHCLIEHEGAVALLELCYCVQFLGFFLGHTEGYRFGRHYVSLRANTEEYKKRDYTLQLRNPIGLDLRGRSSNTLRRRCAKHRACPALHFGGGDSCTIGISPDVSCFDVAF